jgi:hypothetical protein
MNDIFEEYNKLTDKKKLYKSLKQNTKYRKKIL